MSTRHKNEEKLLYGKPHNVWPKPALYDTFMHTVTDGKIKVAQLQPFFHAMPLEQRQNYANPQLKPSTSLLLL